MSIAQSYPINAPDAAGSPSNAGQDAVRQWHSEARRALISVGIFSLLVNLLMLTLPLYLFQLSDRVLTSRSLDTLVMLTIVIVMAVILQAAFDALRRTCGDLLRRERYDALFITVYPVYPALLGPILKRRFGVRFVLDYQDPWVGSWGLTVGGGPGGTVDLKSRASRHLGELLEPFAVRAADAITAVSARTYEDVLARIQASPACATLPLGWEPRDFDNAPAANPFFDPADGQVNLCYVGTLLPTGFGTLQALLAAARALRDREPALYARLRLWFIGTSNQSSGNAYGVRSIVHAIVQSDLFLNK